jgi:hypothetical protein
VFELETLPQKAKRLIDLSHQPLGVQWAHSAIEELARDIFAGSTSDETAQAAAEVLRESARGRRQGYSGTVRIEDTALGTWIVRLGECIGGPYAPTPEQRSDYHRVQ